MSVTPNFSWPLIEPTDFVTNLPADLETLADDIDADVWAIKGTADAALPETIINAAGDLIYGTANDTAARLAIGTAGQVLTVNSGATAPEWAAPAASGGMSLLSTTAITNIAEISITGISQDYNELVVVMANAATVNTNVEMFVRVNSNNGASNYTSVYATPQGLDGSRNATAFQIAGSLTQTANTNNISAVLRFPRYTDTTPTKMMQSAVAFTQNGGIFTANVGSGATRVNAAISSLQFYLTSGNWTAQGNIYIYGVK